MSPRTPRDTHALELHERLRYGRAHEPTNRYRLTLLGRALDLDLPRSVAKQLADQVPQTLKP
jgi:hypothetical protein